MAAMTAAPDEVDEKHEPFEPRFRMLEGGVLSNPTAERLALLMAEDPDLDIERPQASERMWVAAGGRATPDSAKYKRRIIRYPVFRRRLEDLVEERKATEADPIWGKPTWMVNQGYRMAAVDGDVKTMAQFAEMSIKIAQNVSKPAKSTDNGAGNGDETPERGPGAPVTQPISERSAPSPARARLMSMGDSGAKPVPESTAA